MRRGIAILAAWLLALAVAAPVAAGPNVNNGSGGFTGAEGDWQVWDEQTGSGTFGYLFARLDRGQRAPTVDLYAFTQGPAVECGEPSDGVIPMDTTPDGMDWSYTSMQGFGTTTTFDVPKSFATAAATATLDLSVETHVACTDVWEYSTLDGVEVSLDLTATGPIERITDRSSFHVPGSFNEHSSIRQSTRPAEGVVMLGGESMTIDPGMGIIGTQTWMEHKNS